MIKHTPAKIREADRRLKTARFEQDALALACLAEDRGRDIIRSHLLARQQGDPDNPQPITLGVIPRLAEVLSVLYRAPATRRLRRGKELLADDDPAAETFAEMARRCLLDPVMALAEWRRSIVRQVCVSFVENHAARRVSARVFWPYEMARLVTPAAADDIEEDEAVLLTIVPEAYGQPAVFQLYQREGRAWSMWIVDGAGRILDAPYGDSGLLPGGALPLVLTYDALPCGSAYLQIPEGRLDAALSVSALANDLAFIVKTQAHSLLALTSNDPESVRTAPPTDAGPGDMMLLPQGSDLKVIQPTPQIQAIVETIDSQLSYLALAESLPADSFSKDRAPLTGPAWKAAHADLESRRIRQIPLALEYELRAFTKMRTLHNAYAGAWGAPTLDEGLELAVSFARMATPSDVRETQDVFFKDVYAGSASLIDYMAERFACDRTTAIAMYRQIEADRAAYPAIGNAAAMASGPNATLGEGSASGGANVDGFNPDPATATEGASVTDAMLASQGGELAAPSGGPPDPAPGAAAPTAPTADVQATALNGAQVTSAVAIVQAVATRGLPRDSGVAMLQRFFSLSADDAETIMGSVGREFFVEPSPGSVPPSPGVVSAA